MKKMSAGLSLCFLLTITSAGSLFAQTLPAETNELSKYDFPGSTISSTLDPTVVPTEKRTKPAEKTKSVKRETAHEVAREAEITKRLQQRAAWQTQQRRARIAERKRQGISIARPRCFVGPAPQNHFFFINWGNWGFWP